MTVPARRPEDDALDRLERGITEFVEPWEPEHYPQLRRLLPDIATVRSALERLRRHPDAWSQEAFDQQKARAESAEAEVRRLTEGLRDLIKEAPEALDQNAVWVDDLLDLLSASPSDGGEPWESFASSQGGIFNGPHPADEEPGGGGAK